MKVCLILLFIIIVTAWKVCKYGIFLVRIFLYSEEKTQYLDKFQAVHVIKGSRALTVSILTSTEMYSILANSANTKCRPFQSNIDCSNFTIDRLQQKGDLFSYLLVTSRNLLLGVVVPRKSFKILQKIGVNFRQVSLKGILVSVIVLECLDKTFQKYLWKSWIFKNLLLHINISKSDF